MKLLLFLLLGGLFLAAEAAQPFDSLYKDLNYRELGPFRGGRSAAVAGDPSDPMRFYFGATGGGVWQTDNGGQTWRNISDKFFGGSIGAVAVSPSDVNILYVGGGEVTVRGNVSHGDGMWKSDDRGKTWKHIGLPDSRHIPRIRIHPRNPDIVYVAVLGHLFGPNRQRGIYRTTDGGGSWKKILFVDENTGAVDIAMDPNNPRILFASFWQVRRTPYSLSSGGPGSSIWKSTDGGDTWKNITRNKGLPKGVIGISGISVSGANSDRVYAIVEARDGGVFRSDNGGHSWKRINTERKLRQRAWYYTRIHADPRNEDVVYVLNVRFWKSKDGGTSFSSIRTPHGDHHDLWINPRRPEVMVVGDDGGAQVTYNGGKDWSTYHNQPTAQFYRVTTDDHFPYRIYAAQQDNSAIRILSRSSGWGIGEEEWESTAGGESAHLAPRPDNNDIVFGGSYGGLLTRYDHVSGQRRVVDVWPDNPMGHGAIDLKYRFQWNFPILFSPHDPHTLYAAANVLFKSVNEGQGWQAISPDLTRNDTTKMKSSGGPITQDNTSIEYYGTIFAVAASYHEKGVIWSGSDDGLIYLTRDDGKNWKNVTPPKGIMPEWIQINSMEIDPFNPGGLYVAATMYKWDDMRPYLYHTADYGKSWKKITGGLPADQFTRVIRADRKQAGLLFTGTEKGVWFSPDNGRNWRPLQLNLPVVPVTDLAIKGSDLVVATQGRSIWVLDNYSPLRQLTTIPARGGRLLPVEDAYRMNGSRGGSLLRGQNPPNGVIIDYVFQDVPDSNDVVLKILENDGTLIRSFKPGDKKNKMPLEAGHNRFVWDMRYPDTERFEGMILWFGSTRGPKAVPGNYKVRLLAGGDSLEQSFAILKDPRVSTTKADLQQQFDFLAENNRRVERIIKSIRHIRRVRSDIKRFLSTLSEKDTVSAPLKKEAEALVKKLTDIEEKLYQTKNRSPQDPLNFPTRLVSKMATLTAMMGMGDFKPTDQAYEVRDALWRQIEPLLEQTGRLMREDIPALNKLIHRLRIPVIVVPE